VFAAADIDADEFEARMVDDGLKDLAGRTTLYAAWNDHALQASEALQRPELSAGGAGGRRDSGSSGDRHGGRVAERRVVRRARLFRDNRR